MRSSSTIQLLAAGASFSLAAAQNDTQANTTTSCNDNSNDSWFPNGTFNASGSVSTPGFRVNDTYPESTWTWTRYLNVVYESGNRTDIAQTIGLSTDPVQNLTDASSIPYTGCVFVFNDLGSNSNYKNNGQSENGTCNTIFSSECRQHLLSTVRANAASLSSTPSGSRNSFSCPSLFGGSLTTSGPCENQWAGTVSSQFLPNNFTDQVNRVKPGCPLPNVGQSNVTERGFFSWAGTPSTENGNWTLYDREVLNALPVLTVTWLKNTSASVGNGGVVDGSARWNDQRLVCISANVTETGSRNLTQVERDSGVGRRGGGWALMGMVGLSVVVGLVL